MTTGGQQSFHTGNADAKHQQRMHHPCIIAAMIDLFVFQYPPEMQQFLSIGGSRGCFISRIILGLEND